MTDIKRYHSPHLPEGLPSVGVSGIAIYLPKCRVSLKKWCEWYGGSWEKLEATVGRSFRMVAPHESVYTMAANAALRLIISYDVDPRSIGFIGLGTESATDNSISAVVIKGMVDQALETLGKPRLSRQCEVPEIKHACLGGVYAMKSALRYISLDGRGRKAIVISADIAEYARNSSGEPTQGAGAVAQLLEEDPKLYTVDLATAGSATAYRAVDFRKPHKPRMRREYQDRAIRYPDYPVFNGKYSTICYTDQAIHATARMVQKLNIEPRSLYNSLEGAFFHRPYARLPINIMAALYVWGLTRNDEHLRELEAVCRRARADFETMQKEAASNPDLFKGAMGGHINKEVYPESMKVVKYFRDTPKFKEVATKRMHLGVEAMMELGNVYTGSLPAWIAAGMEEAFLNDHELSGKQFFTLGYGSGDAAEAILIRVVDGWREAASKIGFQRALDGAIDLSKEEYEALHDGLEKPCPEYQPVNEFVIDHVGQTDEKGFQDTGIEYYRYTT